MKINVYLKSFGFSQSSELYLYSLQHTYCAPKLAEWSSSTLGSGRILEPDSAATLPDLEVVAQQPGRQVEIWDLGRLRGRLKGLLAGVWKAPTVVIDGQKHVGLEAAQGALRHLGAAGRPPELKGQREERGQT